METKLNKDRIPDLNLMSLKTTDEMKAENQKKSDTTPHGAKSTPFCCSNMKYDERNSAAFLPDEKHDPIKAFMAKVAEVHMCLGELSDEKMCQLEKIFKVNVFKGFDEVSTWFFTPTADRETGTKYLGFLRANTVHRFENTGNNAYLAYYCNDHKQKYRVGLTEITWTKPNKKFASTGDKRIDLALKLPTKPKFDPLGMGGMGFLERPKELAKQQTKDRLDDFKYNDLSGFGGNASKFFK